MSSADAYIFSSFGCNTDKSEHFPISDFLSEYLDPSINTKYIYLEDSTKSPTTNLQTQY